jgi:hypothetical protein
MEVVHYQRAASRAMVLNEGYDAWKVVQLPMASPLVVACATKLCYEGS